MADLLLFVEMESTLSTLHLHGEIVRLALHLNLLGQQMVNML
jgi:hypothetical protein